MSFIDKDVHQIKAKGLTVEKVNAQIDTFKSGIPYTKIVEAATLDNGILKLNDEIIENSISFFESEKNNLSLLKFVPASGAATRMFKFLFQFVSEYNPKEQTFDSYVSNNS